MRTKAECQELYFEEVYWPQYQEKGCCDKEDLKKWYYAIISGRIKPIVPDFNITHVSLYKALYEEEIADIETWMCRDPEIIKAIFDENPIQDDTTSEE